jgi:methyltransferase
MPETLALLVFITVQRLAEMAWARSNERRLRAAGAVEAGAAHYPVIVALHTGWVLYLWVAGWNRPLVLPWLALFAVLQLLRLWVLATLGRRWTTRVLFVPGEALVKRGPYRFISHPNYAVVAAEMFTGPLVFGLWGAAIVFGLLNLAMLAWRIRVEERALKPLRT